MLAQTQHYYINPYTPILCMHPDCGNENCYRVNCSRHPSICYVTQLYLPFSCVSHFAPWLCGNLNVKTAIRTNDCKVLVFSSLQDDYHTAKGEELTWGKGMTDHIKELQNFCKCSIWMNMAPCNELLIQIYITPWNIQCHNAGPNKMTSPQPPLPVESETPSKTQPGTNRR